MINYSMVLQGFKILQQIKCDSAGDDFACLKMSKYDVQAEIEWPQPSPEFDFHEMNFPMGGELKSNSKVNLIQWCWLKA